MDKDLYGKPDLERDHVRTIVANEFETLGQYRRQFGVDETCDRGAWEGSIESHDTVKRAVPAFLNEFISILGFRCDQFSLFFEGLPISLRCWTEADVVS